MPRAFATLFMSRPKLLSSSIKSISSPVKGLCSLGQLWLHCGQVQRSIIRKWQSWLQCRLLDGITDRCGLVPLNMPVWLLPLTCLPPFRRPAKRFVKINRQRARDLHATNLSLYSHSLISEILISRDHRGDFSY